MSIEIGYCNFPLCQRKAEKNGYCISHKIYSDAPAEKKAPYKIPHQSEKKKQQVKDEKPLRDEKEKWFALVRKKLTGTCQCGCGEKSSKKDDTYFRNSCCHIFPKKDFKSVQFHPLNFVERAFFGGCHSVMDDTSMDRWPNMADFEDIRQKFMILAPLLTPQEKAKKFYSHLERLVNGEITPISVTVVDPELKTVVVEEI